MTNFKIPIQSEITSRISNAELLNGVDRFSQNIIRCIELAESALQHSKTHSWLAACSFQALPLVIFTLRHVSITICTHVSFLLDHVFVSHSPACQFRTTTCPKPGCHTCPLHIDVHTDSFHHRTRKSFIFNTSTFLAGGFAIVAAVFSLYEFFSADTFIVCR